MHRFASALAVAALLSSTAVAQVQHGDIILMSTGAGAGIFAIDPSTGAETTVRAGFTVRAGTIAHDNRHLIGLGGTSGNVYSFVRNGNYTTVKTFTDGAAGGIAVDQNESMILAQTTANRLIRIAADGSTSTLTSFLAAWGGPTAICRDGDTGHFIVGFSDGRIAEVNRQTGYKKTITTGLGAVAGVAYVPISGRYVVATPSGIKFVKRDGTVSGTLFYPDLGGIAVDPRSSWIYAIERTTGLLHTVLPSGTPLAPKGVAKRNYRGIAIWGTRQVALKTSGVAGTTAEISLDFRRSQRANYCVALSFANRPGIVIGNVWNRINLAADPLFFLTVCGGLPGATTGFAGKTSIGGLAKASFEIPALPVGTRLYVGAAAVNGSLTGGLDFMNSEVVRIEAR